MGKTFKKGQPDEKKKPSQKRVEDDKRPHVFINGTHEDNPVFIKVSPQKKATKTKPLGFDAIKIAEPTQHYAAVSNSIDTIRLEQEKNGNYLERLTKKDSQRVPKIAKLESEEDALLDHNAIDTAARNAFTQEVVTLFVTTMDTCLQKNAACDESTKVKKMHAAFNMACQNMDPAAVQTLLKAFNAGKQSHLFGYDADEKQIDDASFFIQEIDKRSSFGNNAHDGNHSWSDKSGLLPILASFVDDIKKACTFQAPEPTQQPRPCIEKEVTDAHGRVMLVKESIPQSRRISAIAHAPLLVTRAAEIVSNYEKLSASERTSAVVRELKLG